MAVLIERGLIMSKRGRGRLKGEGKGRGAVQIFIKQRGGRRFMARLYRELRSGEAIAEFINKRFGFYVSGNSIRNMLRQYHVPLNPSGGDRRSPTHVKFRQIRGRDLS